MVNQNNLFQNAYGKMWKIYGKESVNIAIDIFVKMMIWQKLYKEPIVKNKEITEAFEKLITSLWYYANNKNIDLLIATILWRDERDCSYNPKTTKFWVTKSDFLDWVKIRLNVYLKEMREKWLI